MYSLMNRALNPCLSFWLSTYCSASLMGLIRLARFIVTFGLAIFCKNNTNHEIQQCTVKQEPYISLLPVIVYS